MVLRPVFIITIIGMPAQELGIPVDAVNQSYREVLDELKKDAKVKVFLPILVSRSVKDRLQQK